MKNETYVLVHETARKLAIKAIETHELNGDFVIIKEPTRNLEQNAKLHAMFGELEKHKVCWGGVPRNADQWKVLLISGHTIATGGQVEMIKGLEDEIVSLRASSAAMSIKTLSSLIEYTQAFMIANGIESNDYYQEN